MRKNKFSGCLFLSVAIAFNCTSAQAQSGTGGSAAVAASPISPPSVKSTKEEQLEQTREPEQQQQTQPGPSTTSSSNKFILSASANEVAIDLNILPSVKDMQEAQNKFGRDSNEALHLRQNLLENLITASFEVRSVMSRIDDNISRTNELRSVMEEKRQRRVQYADVANFLQSGATEVISSSMVFNGGRAGAPLVVPAAVLAVLGGVLEIGISSYSVHLEKGDHRSSPPDPNMLAPIFGFDTPDTRLPHGVELFMDDPHPQSHTGETRREHLIHQWVRLGRISPVTSRSGKQQVSLLAGVRPLEKQLTIDLLQDRALMLSDLRAAVGQMDREMFEIMRWVREL